MKLKDQFDYAWRYFALHAGQRIALMNYFVGLSTLLSTGLASTYTDKLQNHALGAVIGVLIMFISLMFKKFDDRNKFLTKQGELALKCLEKKLGGDQCIVPIMVFCSEELNTSKLREEEKHLGIVQKQLSHSKILTYIFRTYGFIGFAGFATSTILLYCDVN